MEENKVIRIVDFESVRRKRAAKRSLSGAEQMALFGNLWHRDREIVSEFLETPEGAGVTVPRLQLHPKRHGRLFMSIHDMRDDAKLAFVEFAISKFGYEILGESSKGENAPNCPEFGKVIVLFLGAI